MRLLPALLCMVCSAAVGQTPTPQSGAAQTPPAKSGESTPGAQAGAMPPLNPRDNRTLQEMEGGAITDQTITVAGQDFYQSFTFFWREKPLHDRYTISVHERPSARLGNLVWVEYAQRKVFQTTLPPNRAAVREMGDHAAAIAYQNVVDTDVQRLLFREQDLGADEF